MAVIKEDPAKRRRSIAVTNQNRSTIAAPAGKRRAHSIVPGDRLSPLAKARRSLAPRKSILKISSSINTEEPSEQSSQPSNSQSSLPDDGNITQSMDFTVDYRARIHDHASRKSLGRRVSFAEHAQVRLFQIPNHDNTNSTGSPQSSPIPSPSPEIDRPPILSNENDYPVSFSRNRRRSSVRYSIAGSEDMDLTSADPGAFLQGDEGSALMDEEMEFDENDDMEVTEVLHGDLVRRRSLAGRQPFAPVRSRDSIAFPSDDAIPSDDDNNQTYSVIEDDSQIQSEAEQSREEMEFTVPMGQSLRPPPTEDPMWLALRQVTHSGDTPHEPEASSEDDIQVTDGQQGMDLNDAMVRLMRARDSLGGGTENTTEDMDITSANTNFVVQEDSLLSTDDSLNDDIDEGNETLNVSKVIGRISLGGPGRMSLGYQDSTMDESGIYESITPLSSSTPRHSIIPPQIQEEEEPQEGEPQEEEELVLDIQEPGNAEAPRPAVFQLPPEETNTPSPPPTPATNPTDRPPKSPAFTFVPPPAAPQPPKTPTKPVSPMKPKSKVTFSAAFAPPVTKPSPRKLSASSTPVHGTPNKRSFSVMQDGASEPGRPSPAKRPALDSRSTNGTGTPRKGLTSGQPRASLSPNKRVTSNGLGAPSISTKRQSGYFARRKSLGNALIAPQVEQREEPTPGSASPAKRPSSGRASVGSAPPDVWTRFDRNAAAPAVPSIVLPAEEFQEESATEPILEAAPSPGPTRAPSGPASPRSTVAPIGWTSQPLDTEHVDSVKDDVETIETGESENPPEDVPSISIEQFFSMTNVKFMDELTAPRRSIHPHTGLRQARNAVDIPLSEYYIAMGIDVPQLGLFTRVSKDLEGWMTRSKADFAQAEEEAAKITPELFAEFMRADEEGQAELMHQLNLIRVNARGQAKSDWYDWKLRWVEGLHLTAEQAFNDLQSDAKILEPIKKATEELVPTLEKEYDEIMQELEREQAEVAEIEASDQEYLNDLKVSIAEQNIEVEALRAELTEHTEQLNYLQGRLQELAIGRKEAADAIAKAQHVLQMKENSTRTEVFRLRDELEALEDLHRFHITRVDESMFEYVYASYFKVTVPCRNFLPITSNVGITHVGDPMTKTKDDFPKLSTTLLQAAKALVHRLNPSSCKEIVHELADFWSSCSQLRAQLQLLTVKYPVEIIPVDSSGFPSFRAKTKVMIPTKKAKVFITFNFTPEVFPRWPLSINSLTCDVEVSYGPVSQSTIMQTVSERLSQATPSDNYACLLDACIEAQEIYNQ
ncbi:hypothetical protein P691DRAFT_772204 [Macrolepiota fuliginosa MF-IS2]|uniref:Spc7 kinetochore protein domain-containing protein n=1 Tax=Macrolepiota fuliginosa MF-IS2 TaxID=1400762 RepID=A0A9P5XKT0_9AGAR|nr:hypothetical protein P691DRAFT_772204 [Macrolepiota fuliginosa MF-IS2]